MGVAARVSRARAGGSNQTVDNADAKSERPKPPWRGQLRAGWG
jgi:hypothetical protein